MNNDIIARLSKFAFISSIIGLCTLGICPAFGIMALVVPYVFSIKGAKLDDKSQDLCRKGRIMGAISLVLFVIDIVLAVIYL